MNTERNIWDDIFAAIGIVVLIALGLVGFALLILLRIAPLLAVAGIVYLIMAQ